MGRGWKPGCIVRLQQNQVAPAIHDRWVSNNQLTLRLSTIIVSSSAAGMGPRNISTHESKASPALSGSSTGTVDANEANWSEPSWQSAASLDSVMPSVYKTNKSPGLSCMAVCVYGVPAIIPS